MPFDANVAALGIVLFGGLSSSLGVNGQKRSHTANQRRPQSQQRLYILRWDWWLGFAGVAAGAVADFWALGMASQSLVAAIGGSTVLLANTVFARFYNKEEVFQEFKSNFQFVVNIVLFNVEYL